MKITRRQFFRRSAAWSAAGLAAPLIMPAHVFGANERLTLAHIGVGGMGGVDLANMLKFRQAGEVNIAAVCEVDSKRLAAATPGR